MKSEDWTLQVLSHEPMNGWARSAEQLKAFLDALSEAIAAGPYGVPVVWKSYQEMDVDRWRDVGAIEHHLLTRRDSNDDGTLTGVPQSSTVVQAYLDHGADTDFSDGADLLNLRAALGHEPRFGSISCQAEFFARKPEPPAKPLHDHDPRWLADLLGTTAASVNADDARIYTIGVDDALAERVDLPPLGLGILSLAPYGIDLDPLPASLTAYPCPTGYPDGQVIVADLDRAATDPEPLVDDLLILNEALEAASHANSAD